MDNSMEEYLYDFTTRLQSIGGRNDKESFIKQYKDVDVVKNFLKFALDPMLVFGIQSKKLNKYLGKEIYLISFQNLFECFEYLTINNTGRDEDIKLVASYINSLDEHLREFAIQSITKSIKLGANVKTINKALGEKLLTEFNVMLAHPFEKYADKIEGKTLYATEKLDGCFIRGTKVNMADGSKKKIEDIKVGEEVLSFNEVTKEISSKKVTNVFDNGLKPKEEIRVLKFDEKVGGKITGTNNHKIFTPKGWKRIDELSIGDSVYTYGYIYSPEQIAGILGSGLGDGSILKDSPERPFIRMSLARKNNDNFYHSKLTELFSDFRGSDRKRISGYGTEMTVSTVKTMRNLPYWLTDNSFIRGVSYIVEEDSGKEISPLALAILYMDDGTKRACKDDGDDYSKNVSVRASINTNRLKFEEVRELSYAVHDNFGIESTLRDDKILKDNSCSYCLEFDAHNTILLFDLIAPYVTEDMNYKLGTKWRDVPKIEWWNKKGEFGLVEDVITSIEMYNKHEKTRVYDIEVEDNHTYFVDNLAVHNCRAIAMKQDGKIKFFSRSGQQILGLEDIEKDLLLLNEGIYDGELLIKDAHLYKDRAVLQETLKITRKDGVKKGLDFWIFDTITHEDFQQGKSNLTYTKRREILDELPVNDLENVHVLPVLYKGKDIGEIQKILKELESKGLEGVMLNVANAFYTTSRSSGILKMKTFLSMDEFCTGVFEGEGKYKGKLGGITVNYKGFELRVGSGFTDYEREKYWSNPELIIGKVVEIQYFRESENQSGGLSVSFPVFVTITDKTEASYN